MHSENSAKNARNWPRSAKKRPREQNPVPTQKTPETRPEPLDFAIHSSIDKLELNTFIDCVVDEDLSGLVIRGTPPDYMLQAAWEKLHSDYLQRIGGVHVNGLIQRERSIKLLVFRLDRIQLLVDVARRVSGDEIASALQAEGFHYNPDAEPDEQERQLKRIEAKIKPDRVQLQILMNSRPKEQEKQKITRKDFTAMLWRISNAEGFVVRAKDLTVGEYCEAVVRMRDRKEPRIQNPKPSATKLGKSF